MAPNREPQTASLDKVRDILFGEQAKTHEKNVSRLERSLRREIQEASSQLSKRANAYERATSKELATLTERLEVEEGDAAAFQEETTTRLEDLSKSLERGLTQLGQRHARELDQLRQEMARQNKALQTQVAKAQAELEEELLAEIEDLRSTHIDREQLAGLLADVSARIRGKKAKG